MGKPERQALFVCLMQYCILSPPAAKRPRSLRIRAGAQIKDSTIYSLFSSLSQNTISSLLSSWAR